MMQQTADLKRALAAIGLNRVRVRSDKTLKFTTATLLDPDEIAVVEAHAAQLAESGTYGVEIRRYPDGCAIHALVTTRLAGQVRKVTACDTPPHTIHDTPESE